ncbi:MAG: hypothetical protein AB8G22_18610 [Saprospiraceae bacterium]
MNKAHFFLLTLLIISTLSISCKEETATDSADTASESVAETLAQEAAAKALSASEPSASFSEYITEFDSSKYAFRDGIVDLNWQILAMVAFEEEYNEELDQYIPYPKFSPTVQALAGKEVYIQGYYIPVDESGDADIVVLSAFPFSACFFCGNAGPESVMDIQLKNKTKLNFKTDDRITFKGKLKLNDSDLYYLNYILEEAELVKE